MPVKREGGNWKGVTDGTPWMHKTLIKWLAHTPLAIPYFCMGWIVPFYMLFRREGYRATYDFYRKRFGINRVKAFFKVYINHFRFGQIIIDRFAAYAGKHFEFTVEGEEFFNELERAEEGFMQISSHVGNYELAGYSLIPKHKSFYALVFSNEAASIMEPRSRIFGEHKVNMVPIGNDMSHIFILSNALRQGDIVSMPGDRIFGSPRSISCSFLGEEAKFPLGPFAMASQRELPALALFVMKQSIKSYKIYVRKVMGNNPKELCQSYVTELEKIVKQYPTQWFNHYNFWM